MSRARDLSKLGNPNVIVADTERVGFGTQVPENAANASSSLISAGIVTATGFTLTVHNGYNGSGGKYIYYAHA